MDTFTVLVITETGSRGIVATLGEGGTTGTGRFFYGTKLEATLNGIENITVDDQSRVKLIGDNAANRLITSSDDDLNDGRPGNDTLDGREDNDGLIGGLGVDSLFGGAGDDTLFVGDTADSLGATGTNVETLAQLYDGVSGFDTIDYSDLDGFRLNIDQRGLVSVGARPVFRTDITDVESGALVGRGRLECFEKIITTSGNDLFFISVVEQRIVFAGDDDDFFYGTSAFRITTASDETKIFHGEDGDDEFNVDVNAEI